MEKQKKQTIAVALSIVIMLIVVLCSVISTAMMYTIFVDIKNYTKEDVSVYNSTINEIDEDIEMNQDFIS